MIGERAPLGGRVPELEGVRRHLRDAALGKVRAARLAAHRIREHAAIERRRELVQLEHRHPLAAQLAQLRVLLHARDHDVEAAGELLGDLDEALALELHHEAEDIAVLLTPEAVKEALVRRDVERRCLLAVEGAQALPVTARLAQLHVLTDDRDDVGRGADLRDDVVGNHDKRADRPA